MPDGEMTDEMAVFMLRNFRATPYPEDMVKGKHHANWAWIKAADILQIEAFDEINRLCQAERHQYEVKPPQASYIEFLFDVRRHKYHLWSACSLCHEGMVNSYDAS